MELLKSSFLKQKVKWPHKYILAGRNKECVMYDQLTMGQWMAGFCRDMREENDQNSKNAMLDYLISLLDYSNDFSCNSAKASHAVLLCRMENGEIKDFTETDKIDRVRHVHMQRHTFNDQDASKKPSNLWCVSITMQVHALNKVHTKRKESSKNMHVRFVLQRVDKISHILKVTVQINRNKKNSKPGCKSAITFCSKIYLVKNCKFCK